MLDLATVEVREARQVGKIAKLARRSTQLEPEPVGNPEWQSVFQKRPTLEQGGRHSVLSCPSVNGLSWLLGMWMRRWIPFGQSNSLEMKGSWELATAGAQSELGTQQYPQHPSQNKHTPTGNPQALKSASY